MSRFIDIYLDNEKEGTNKKQRFAQKKEILRTEFYQAKQAGLNPTLKVEVRADSYNREKYLWFDGERYKIYRTYTKDDEHTEIVAERF